MAVKNKAKASQVEPPNGGFAPATPGFIAFRQTGPERDGVAAPPVRTRVSAQVASLRSLILCTSKEV